VQTLSQSEARCMDAVHQPPTTSAKGTSAGCASSFVAHLLLTIAPPLYGLQQTTNPTLLLEPVQRAIYKKVEKQTGACTVPNMCLSTLARHASGLQAKSLLTCVELPADTQTMPPSLPRSCESAGYLKACAVQTGYSCRLNTLLTARTTH